MFYIFFGFQVKVKNPMIIQLVFLAEFRFYYPPKGSVLMEKKSLLNVKMMPGRKQKLDTVQI